MKEKVEQLRFITKEEILEHGRKIINIPLGKADTTGRLSTGKGAIGTVIEESWFDYSPNSNSEPDFKEAGVELKVTPFIKNKNGSIRAKERLVCNIINYMEEYKNEFETSSFFKKCNTMLLMLYEHLKDTPKKDFCINEVVLFSFPEEDLKIIKQDFETIIEKIKNGEAHNLSEGATLYLSACTKGASAKSLREQPFSDIKAKQRAFSLKSSYMTQIINKYIFGSERDPHIIKNINDLNNITFEKYIYEKIKQYFGKTQKELKEIFNIQSNAKNLNEIILARILGISGKISNTDEFKKANIIAKTLRVNKNNKIKESIPLINFNFLELIEEEDWEESKLYNYISDKKIMFVIFKQRKEDDQYVLSDIKFWNISNKDLDELEKVWKQTKDIIENGVELEKIGNKLKNNLPKKTENKVAHVRPRARNSKDVLPLPDGRFMPKQCFWLNNTFIEKELLYN